MWSVRVVTVPGHCLRADTNYIYGPCRRIIPTLVRNTDLDKGGKKTDLEWHW